MSTENQAKRDAIEALLREAGYRVRTPFDLDGPHGAAVIVSAPTSARTQTGPRAFRQDFRDEPIRSIEEAQAFIRSRRN